MLGRILFQEASNEIAKRRLGLCTSGEVDDSLALEVDAVAKHVAARYSPLFEAGLQLLAGDDCGGESQVVTSGGGGGGGGGVGRGLALKGGALPCGNLLALRAARRELGRWQQFSTPKSPALGQLAADSSSMTRAAAALLQSPSSDAAWAELGRNAATLRPEVRISLQCAVRQGRERIRRGLPPRWSSVRDAASTALVPSDPSDEDAPRHCRACVQYVATGRGRDLVATSDVVPGGAVAVETARAVAPLSPAQKDSRCDTCLARLNHCTAPCPTPAACWIGRLEPLKGSDTAASPAATVLGLRAATGFPPRVQLARTAARAGGAAPQWAQEVHFADLPRGAVADALAWTAAALSVERHVWGHVRTDPQLPLPLPPSLLLTPDTCNPFLAPARQSTPGQARVLLTEYLRAGVNAVTVAVVRRGPRRAGSLPPTPPTVRPPPMH